MKITYIGACLDSSGYAEAARNNIAALNEVDIDLAVVSISFEHKKSDLGKLGHLVSRLMKKTPDSHIRIIHATPPNYHKLVEKNKYNIGYAAWETSRLPDNWTKMINTLDEVWVPSKHNVSVFKESGVNIPVICIPHTFDTLTEHDSNTVIENRKDEDFVFYSIFQWLERKNPAALIRAYLTEFKKEEDVVLVLKTFAINPGNQQEADMIRKKIQAIKNTLYLDSYPRMLLITSLLGRNQVKSLHLESDCYVSLHRCEGFGIPIAEAMLAGKPVITTGYGGPADFVKHEKTGYLVDHLLTPVANMPWEMYQGYGVWAEPDVMQTRCFMREMFDNQAKAKAMGKKARAWTKRNFSWESIGEKMKKRLEEISSQLEGNG